MSQLSKFKFKPQAYELDAYTAPGHLFFCRRIELPSDLEKGEEEGYVFLELENLSPFPLEHLYYGYHLDEAKRFAFVYAAYKRRFEGVDPKSWRRIDASLPDFLIALKNGSGDGSPLVLVTKSSLVALAFDGKSSVPARFYASPRPVSEEGDAKSEKAEAQEFWESMSEKIGGGSPRIWVVDSESKWIGQTANFVATLLDKSPAAKVTFSRDEIWKADLRDEEMVVQSKRDEQQNAFLWKGIIGLAAAIGLLILGEVYWAGSSLYLAQREKWNNDRVGLVASIDKLQTTTNTLLQYRESNLVPFQIITELWPYSEWPKIIYRRFETDGPDGIIIDARADNQREMTEFKKRLERLDKVVSVELSNQVTNPSGSTFKTTIRFVPGAFITSAEVAKK